MDISSLWSGRKRWERAEAKNMQRPVKWVRESLNSWRVVYADESEDVSE